jgi:hypothetical protein
MCTRKDRTERDRFGTSQRANNGDSASFHHQWRRIWFPTLPPADSMALALVLGCLDCLGEAFGNLQLGRQQGLQRCRLLACSGLSGSQRSLDRGG